MTLLSSWVQVNMINFFSLLMNSSTYIPAGIYQLEVNNRNIRTRCKIYLKLTIKTPKRRQWRCSGVSIVNFEHISHLVLVFLLLALNMWLSVGKWEAWNIFLFVGSAVRYNIIPLLLVCSSFSRLWKDLNYVIFQKKESQCNIIEFHRFHLQVTKGLDYNIKSHVQIINY